VEPSGEEEASFWPSRRGKGPSFLYSAVSSRRREVILSLLYSVEPSGLSRRREVILSLFYSVEPSAEEEASFLYSVVPSKRGKGPSFLYSVVPSRRREAILSLFYSVEPSGEEEASFLYSVVPRRKC